MGLKLVTPTSVAVLTTDQLRRWARIESDDADSTVTDLLNEAVDYCQAMSWRAMGRAVYQQTLDAFPCGSVIELYRPPLIQVDWIKYVDLNGDTQTWDSANYDVDTITEPGRVGLGYGKLWPIALPRLNAVTIQFQAGYTSTEAIPPGLKQAVKAVAKYWFDGEAGAALPAYVDGLLMRYRHGSVELGGGNLE